MTLVRDIFNKFPNRGFKSAKLDNAIQWVGKNISTPENRLIIGVSALVSQPFIDLYNKDVDEKTRRVSCARTIGKTVAGIITGVAVRYAGVKLAKNFSLIGEVGTKIGNKGKEITKSKKFFTPSEAKAEDYDYKQYQNAIGTGLAIIGLLFTNFLIDMPLTNFLTNILVKKIDKPGSQAAAQVPLQRKGGTK